MGAASFVRISWSLLLFLLAAGLAATACGDGGWGNGEPDTSLVPARDVPVAVDTAADTATGDVVTVCYQGPGNELGIGKHCTKGGGECPQPLKCDIDLDPQGAGVCIKLLCKAEADCGTHAGCCKPTGSPINVCIYDDCLPPECADLKGN